MFAGWYKLDVLRTHRSDKTSTRTVVEDKPVTVTRGTGNQQVSVTTMQPYERTVEDTQSVVEKVEVIGTVYQRVEDGAVTGYYDVTGAPVPPPAEARVASDLLDAAPWA